MSETDIPELKFFAKYIHSDGNTADILGNISTPIISKISEISPQEDSPAKAIVPETVKAVKKTNRTSKTMAPKRPLFGSDIIDMNAELQGVLKLQTRQDFKTSHQVMREKHLGKAKTRPVSNDVQLRYQFGGLWSAAERQYLINKYPVAALLLQRGYDVFSSDYKITKTRRKSLLAGIKKPQPEHWNSLRSTRLDPLHAELIETGVLTSSFPYAQLIAKSKNQEILESNILSEAAEKLIHDRGIPSNIVYDLISLSDVKSDLKISDLASEKVFWFDPFNSRSNILIDELFSKISGEYTHVMLVPWLGMGGGELVSLWHAEAISKSNGRLLMIGTDGVKQEWVHRLPKSSTYMCLPSILTSDKVSALNLDQDDILSALTFFIGKLAPRTLHVINSYTGFNLLKTDIDWGETLVFVSLFGIGKDSHGFDAGYWVEAGKLKGVTNFLTDNSVLPDQRSESFGVPREDVIALKYPTAATRKFENIDAEDRPKVLWASRLDREKLPEMVFDIAAQMPGVDFHMFGAHVLNDDPLATPPSNVTLRGAYAGWPSLPNENFSCLLFTSMWEGLPNVTIEALGSGLPIVASNVGAIQEVVRPDCGVLIDDVFNPKPYVKAINKIIKDPRLRSALSQAAISQIEDERNLDVFTVTLAEFGYI